MAAPVVAIERIGDLLVREGLITREQLARALQEQKQSGTRVGYNLVKLGFIEENELTKMLARQYKMPAIDLARFEVDPKIAKMIPTELAVKITTGQPAGSVRVDVPAGEPHRKRAATRRGVRSA